MVQVFRQKGLGGFIGPNGIDFGQQDLLKYEKYPETVPPVPTPATKAYLNSFLKGINDFLVLLFFHVPLFEVGFSPKRKEAISFCSDCFSFSDSAFHLYLRVKRVQPIGLDDFTTFHTHGFRHDNHKLVAFSCADP